nr:MAG TPA: hypothetical protein [Caudoviricetes sp.]
MYYPICYFSNVRIMVLLKGVYLENLTICLFSYLILYHHVRLSKSITYCKYCLLHNMRCSISKKLY